MSKQYLSQGSFSTEAHGISVVVELFLSDLFHAAGAHRRWEATRAVSVHRGWITRTWVFFFVCFFDRMMSSRITLYSTYMALCFVQMVFCCRSLGQSSPCWIEPSPDWTAWIRRRIAGRRCPPAALLWTPALHCTQPAAWPASLRTPVEGAEHRHINHLVLIQFV